MTAADILAAELAAAGHDPTRWHAAILPRAKSVGIQGDARTYGNTVILWPLSGDPDTWASLGHDLVAKVSTRITNEVQGVVRVLLDVTGGACGDWWGSAAEAS